MDDENRDEETEGDEEKSFRERVEEIREQRSEEGDPEEDDRRERMEEMMGGGPGGMGGGNPFAQMMSGMMGGGPGGMGPGSRGEEEGNIRIVRELEALRDEISEASTQLERIADALEED